MNRSILHAGTALVIVLGLSFFVALEINGLLGISIKEKELPKIPAAADMLKATITDSSAAAPALPLRIADFGSVGVIPDAENWGNDYSHNLRHLEKAIMPHPPYIDRTQFDRVESEFRAYVDLLAAKGINGLIVPFLLEFINFDRVEDGNAVYGVDDNFRRRHLALRKNFKHLFEYARLKGIDIFLYSDMVILTPPLEAYLVSKIGSLDTTHPHFWDVYQLGLEELFIAFPEVKGIYIRIGEAGTIYNIQGWDYRSELLVKTGPAVRRMLNAFLDVAEKFDKLVVFRTWSVGVGQIGDMHTNPKTYHDILDPIKSEQLIVSTKYCNGDYYSFTPLNQTLYQGGHKRLIEFQARREFEAFNAIPLFVGRLYQEALLRFLETNQHIQGIWLWTQYGGPLRAGPLSLYPFHGFNLITDLNVHVTAQLALNPGLDIGQAIEIWIIDHFGKDPVLVSELSHVLLSSSEIMKKGLYISEFAKKEVKALGLLPPPMLWIFEWDIVTAGNAVLSSIYFISGDEADAMVAEGRQAVAEARIMRQKVLHVKGRVEKNHQAFDDLIASLDYEINLFDVLSSYRQYFLNYYKWVTTGDKVAYHAWKESLRDFDKKEKDHTRQYGRDLDFPAFNFIEARNGAQLAANTLFSRNMAVILVLSIGVTMLAELFYLTNSRWRAGLRILAGTLMLPFRQTIEPPSPAPSWRAPFWILFLSIGLGAQSLTGFAAPITCLVIYTFLTTYLVLLMLFLGRHHPAALVSTLSPIMLLFLVYLLFSSLRGPAMLWYFFWTSEPVRMVLTMVSFFLLIWSYVVLYASARTHFQQTRASAVSTIMLVQGIQLILLGALSHVLTLEKSLTAINDELLVLPGGLSRILGITTHLNIPTTIPAYLFYIGLGLAGGGLVIKVLSNYGKQRTETGEQRTEAGSRKA